MTSLMRIRTKGSSTLSARNLYRMYVVHVTAHRDQAADTAELRSRRSRGKAHTCELVVAEYGDATALALRLSHHSA
jgi:hypothetical protein